jgi:hypothetical protein
MATFAQNTVNLAEVRVINALVGFGPVDVYIDGKEVALGLEAETASIYFTQPEGPHTVAVRLPGADPLSAPIADVLVTLAPNSSRSLIVYQKQFCSEGYAPPVEQSGAMMILDDNRTPLQLGKTRLTAVHLAVGTPNRISIAYPSRASLLHELRLEESYGTVDVDAQEYSLTLVDAESPTLDILQREQQSYYANTLYTLVIVPDITPPTAQPNNPCQLSTIATRPRMFAVSAPVDPPQNGIRLRIIHAAHDTQVVDVYIDERLVAQRVNYSRFTEYLGLADFSHRITLRAYGDPPNATPLAVAEFTITEANREQVNWTLLLLNATDANSAALGLIRPASQTDDPDQLINTTGGQMIMVLVPDNISQTRLDFARVRLLHAVDGAAEMSLMAPAFPPPVLPPNVTPTITPEPPLNATPVPPVTLVESVIFGSEANEHEVPAGLYDELRVIAGQSLGVETLPSEELVSGLVYTFVVIGNPAGSPPIQVLQFADYGRGLPPTRLYIGTIAITSGPEVNVRRLPSTTTAVVGRVANDTEVEVLGRNVTGEWIRIRFTDPTSGDILEGWVSEDLIRVTRLGVPINILTLPPVSGGLE